LKYQYRKRKEIKPRPFYAKGCGQPSPEPVTSSLGEDETMIMVEDEIEVMETEIGKLLNTL